MKQALLDRWSSEKTAAFLSRAVAAASSAVWAILR